MPNAIRTLLMVIAAGLLAALTGFVLRPFLPPDITRYLAVGLAFGAITFLEEAFVKRSRNALWQAAIAAGATVAVLWVLDRIW